MKFNHVCDIVLISEMAYREGEHVIIMAPDAFEKFLRFNKKINKAGRTPLEHISRNPIVRLSITEDIIKSCVDELQESGFPQSADEATVDKANTFSRQYVEELFYTIFQDKLNATPSKAKYAAEKTFRVLSKAGAIEKVSFIELKKQAKKDLKQITKEPSITQKIYKASHAFNKEFYESIKNYLTYDNATYKEMAHDLKIVESDREDFRSTLDVMVEQGSVERLIGKRGSEPEYRWVKDIEDLESLDSGDEESTYNKLGSDDSALDAFEGEGPYEDLDDYGL